MFVDKENIMYLLLFLLFIFIMCFLVYLKAYGANTIEFGAYYNSNTKSEKIDFMVAGEKKEEHLEIQFKNKIHKEQREDALYSLSIDTSAQINYYPKEKLYYYSNLDYYRDVELGILDETDLGAGIGYKTEKYFSQGGLASKTIFFIDENQRDLFLKLLGGFQIPFLGNFKFRERLGFDYNLSNSPRDDYELISDNSLILDLLRNLYLSLNLDYRYKNKPPLGFPKDLKIYTMRIGVNF